MSITQKRAPILFYSYSASDERFRQALDKHLSVLRRDGTLSTWSMRKIGVGDDWRVSIETELNRADVFVLLISADFLDSDFCWTIEMRNALERHERGEAIVVPVIVRDCDWRNTPIGRLQVLPTGAKAVVEWRNRDSAWSSIAKTIRERINSLESAQANAAEVLVIDADTLRVVDDSPRPAGRSRQNEPWRIVLPEEGVPRLFAFKAANMFDGVCEIEYHELPDRRTLFVISDVAGNPGQSATNSIEFLARQVVTQYAVQSDRAVFVQHHGLLNGVRDWSLVDFAEPVDAESLGRPSWREMTPSDWESFGFRPRKPPKTPSETQSVLIKGRRRTKLPSKARPQYRT